MLTKKPVIPDDSTDDDPVIAEREAKRKEIQSLIMKYAALDDIYGKSTTDAIASKYQKIKDRENKLINNNNVEDELDEDDFVVVPDTTKRLGQKAPLVSSEMDVRLCAAFARLYICIVGICVGAICVRIEDKLVSLSENTRSRKSRPHMFGYVYRTLLG